MDDVMGVHTSTLDVQDKKCCSLVLDSPKNVLTKVPLPVQYNLRRPAGFGMLVDDALLTSIKNARNGSTDFTIRPLRLIHKILMSLLLKTTTNTTSNSHTESAF